MKKLWFLIFILFACSEDIPEPEYCYTCLKEATAPDYYSSYTIDMCGMTETAIKELIEDNTKTVGNIKYTMRCNR